MTNVTLVRGLGAIAATAIVVGDVIGTGVFLKARVMTCNVGTPGRVLLVWIVGGLLSLAGALTYAELAAMMPRAGGEYVFIREAYGRLWGFLYGWTRFFVATTGGLAGLAAGFAIFLNIASGGRLGRERPRATIVAAACRVVLARTLVNCAQITVGGRIAVGLATLKVVLVAGVGLGAFLLARRRLGALRAVVGRRRVRRRAGRRRAAASPASARRCSARCGPTTAGTKSRTSLVRSGTRSGTCRSRSSAASASSRRSTSSPMPRTSTCSRRPTSPASRCPRRSRPRS